MIAHMTFVYFAKGTKSGHIKIGYSKDPDKRCKEFDGPASCAVAGTDQADEKMARQSASVGHIAADELLRRDCLQQLVTGSHT